MLLQAPQPAPPPSPDVILVVIDDVAWDDIEDATTPAIDELQSQGASFTGFHSMPICSPTRVALWTGLYPRSLGVGQLVNVWEAEEPLLDPDMRTLPRAMAEAGYATCLVGKWHAGAFLDATGEAVPELGATGLGGFDSWRAGIPSNVGAPLSGGTGYSDWYRVDDGVGRFVTEYATEEHWLAAEQWWLTTSSPRFMAVCLNAPHGPFHRPPDGWFRTDRGPGKTANYLMMLESADIVIEQLRDLAPDAWFILVSDNGTPPFTNGSADMSKRTTFRRGVNVPLIIDVPGDREVPVAEGLCGIYDLFSTIACIAGVPGSSDGVNLLPATGGEEKIRNWVVSERWPSNGGTTAGGIGALDDFMIRTDRWKMRRLDDVEWLYDLYTYPNENIRKNVAGPNLTADEVAAVEQLRAFERELPPRGGPE